ncbi:MAG: metallophosphoesterase family protein [Bacteroidia bacterium]|nr:metallophosphoesterase family protein [Bacteroidia bacterium]
MENLKENKVVYFLIIILTCNSCMKDADLTGFLYSDDPVNERVKQSLEWNKKNPNREVFVPGTDYTLLIAGDTEIGGTANLDTLIARTKKPGVAGFMIAGDITSGDSEGYNIIEHDLDEKNPGPAFYILGNHDLFFNGWDNYYSYFGSSTYAFTVKTNDASDLYICLDSGNGTIGSRQLKWLEDLLEKDRKNHRFCIIISHVNFFREHHTFSANPLVDELHVLLDLFYRYSIDMVITGHDHHRSEEFFGKTHYITLDAFFDGFKEASYLRLEIQNGKLISRFEKP